MKFKYGDRVNMDKVSKFDWNINGFYKGQVGTVVNVVQTSCGKYFYNVRLVDGTVTSTIEEHQLDLAPRKNPKPLGSLRA